MGSLPPLHFLSLNQAIRAWGPLGLSGKAVKMRKMKSRGPGVCSPPSGNLFKKATRTLRLQGSLTLDSLFQNIFDSKKKIKAATVDELEHKLTTGWR
jgi:hypothetical protein